MDHDIRPKNQKVLPAAGGCWERNTALKTLVLLQFVAIKYYCRKCCKRTCDRHTAICLTLFLSLFFLFLSHFLLLFLLLPYIFLGLFFLKPVFPETNNLKTRQVCCQCRKPQASPDCTRTYNIHVIIWWGTYQSLMDLGCNQTSNHHFLVQDETLDRQKNTEIEDKVLIFLPTSSSKLIIH